MGLPGTQAPDQRPKFGTLALKAFTEPRPACGHSNQPVQPYAGFNRLYDSGRVRETACWAHVRRKFFDIQQAHASPSAGEAMERIAEMYAIQSEIRGRSPDERKQVREARSRSLLARFHDWMQNTLKRVSRKSDIAAAIVLLDDW